MQQAESKTKYIVRTVFLALSMCAQPSLQAQSKPLAPPGHQQTAQVPFVGCKADGQAGPLEAPSGKNKTVPITPELAQELAYDKAEQGPGVLAPRGWNCFETYGSNGGTLYVTPQPINSELVFSDKWKGLDGPAVQLSVASGGTSGRFEVAEIIARVFPAHRAFVRSVIAEGIEPASSFPYGPYPTDKLAYKSKNIVEYETPPNTDGLGTNSMLQKNGNPISGVAILAGADTDLIHLSMRLPANLALLKATIIQQVEQDATQY